MQSMYVLYGGSSFYMYEEGGFNKHTETNLLFSPLHPGICDKHTYIYILYIDALYKDSVYRGQSSMYLHEA